VEGLIADDDPRADDVRALLERHLAFANDHSPPEDVHALDVEALAHPSVTFVAYRVDGELLGVGALRDLGDGHGELKSMHISAAARGRGIGGAIVTHLVGVAEQRGMSRLSLETGTPDAFAPARSLYTRHGFTECGPFGDYGPSDYSTFMSREV
jgi:putative acetyltransferase